VVGERAELEAGEPVAAEDDPGQRRGQLPDRFDPAGQQGAIAGALFLGRRGDGSFLR
jgi:hypothetical protein